MGILPISWWPMRDPVPPPAAPPAEPGARVSLRALLRAGPVARAIGRADLRLYRVIRTAARPPALGPVERFSALGEHAAGWLVLGAAGMAIDRPRRARWRPALPTAAGAHRRHNAGKGAFPPQRAPRQGRPPPCPPPP